MTGKHTSKSAPAPVRRHHGDEEKKVITKEQLEALNQRIYDNTVAKKKETLQKLEKKFYHELEPKVITREALEHSVQRQVTDEMKKRKQKQEELEKKHYKPQEFKTLTSAELEESVKRIYADAVRQKQESVHKVDQKLETALKSSQGSVKKLSADEIKACGERLCKPSKRSYTEEEINAILFG
jgi:hypothetical protein